MDIHTIQDAIRWAGVASEYLTDAERGRDPKIKNLYGAKDFLRLAMEVINRQISDLSDGGLTSHTCADNPVPYPSDDGALGHGWECGVCGLVLKAG